MKQPVLLYTSDEHGTNMDTMFSMSHDSEPILLLVKTTRSGPNSHIIGALYADDICIMRVDAYIWAQYSYIFVQLLYAVYKC